MARRAGAARACLGGGVGAHLQAAEFDAADRLVLGDREVHAERVHPHVQRVRVAVLVDRPVELRRVRVPRADVLRLEVLELGVHLAAVTHRVFRPLGSAVCPSKRGGAASDAEPEAATAQLA